MQENHRPQRPPVPPDRRRQLEWEINNATLGPGISRNLIVQLTPCLDAVCRLCADGEKQPMIRRPCSQIRGSCEKAKRLLLQAQSDAEEERSSRCRLIAFQKRMDTAAQQLFLSLDRQPPPASPCGILLPLQAMLTGCLQFCAVGSSFPLTPGLRRDLPRVRALLFQSRTTAANAAGMQRCK